MNEVISNQLFSLIERASDNSNALRMPSVKEIVMWIGESGHSEAIYTRSNAGHIVEELRANQLNTWSGIRHKLEGLLHCILEVLCQREGLDLMYRYLRTGETLHFGIVTRETFTGEESLWGLRSIDLERNHHWEYHAIDTPRLFDAIAFRVRDLHRVSPYGWTDPLMINSPSLLTEVSRNEIYR